MCYKKHQSFPPQRFALQLLLLPPHADTEDVLLRLVPNTGCDNPVYLLQILNKKTEMACLMLKKKGRSSMASEIVGPSLWESTEQQVGHEKARSKLCIEIKVGSQEGLQSLHAENRRIKKKARDQWMCKSSKFKATGNVLTQLSSCVLSQNLFLFGVLYFWPFFCRW